MSTQHLYSLSGEIREKYYALKSDRFLSKSGVTGFEDFAQLREMKIKMRKKAFV
jgi:hypothetical protein